MQLTGGKAGRIEDVPPMKEYLEKLYPACRGLALRVMQPVLRAARFSQVISGHEIIHCFRTLNIF